MHGVGIEWWMGFSMDVFTQTRKERLDVDGDDDT